MPDAVEHLVRACFPLLAVALIVRPLRRRLPADVPVSVRHDLPLALICGLVFAALCTFHLADAALKFAPVTGADFHDYCGCIGASRGDHAEGWRASRSVAAGMLPSLLARWLGVIDGLLVGSVVSLVVLGAGIYTWARALHSRTAGVAAVVLACAVAPLVVLGRTLTFYPGIVAVTVLASGLCVLALRTGHRGVILAAGGGMGLVLLMDVRGLVWVPAMLLPALVAVLLRGPWRRRGASLLLLFIPILGSYLLADHAFLTGVPSLERQVESFVDDALTTLGEDAGPAPGASADRGAVWGRTPLSELPGSMARTLLATRGLAGRLGGHPENARGRALHITPWLGVSGVGLIAALWGLRRRRWLWVGLLVPLLPFLSALHSSAWVLFRPRYLATGAAVIPVLLGVGVGIVAAGSLKAKDLKAPVRVSWGVPATGAALLLLVLGTIPNWYGPRADWRVPFSADRTPVDALLSAVGGDQVGPRLGTRCTDALKADLEAGIEPGSAILGWTPDGLGVAAPE